MDTQELIRAVREFVFDMYPDDDPVAITIELKRSGPMRLPVPKRSAVGESGLRDNERLVFSHLPGRDKPGITIEELLKRTGYSDKSHVHKLLRILRIKGFATQDESKGYRKTE
jgi:hypothetical protein